MATAKGYVSFFDLQALWNQQNASKKKAKVETATVYLWFDKERDSLVRKGKKIPASNARIDFDSRRSARVSLSAGSALHFA